MEGPSGGCKFQPKLNQTKLKRAEGGLWLRAGDRRRAGAGPYMDWDEARMPGSHRAGCLYAPRDAAVCQRASAGVLGCALLRAPDTAICGPASAPHPRATLRDALTQELAPALRTIVSQPPLRAVAPNMMNAEEQVWGQ